MGKLSNTLLMLDLLSTGKVYTIKELANILEVSPRQVRTYKEALEIAGVYIGSTLGRNGGYYCKSSKHTIKVDFSIKDLNVLEKIYLNMEDEEQKNLLNHIIDKVRLIVVNYEDNNVLSKRLIEEYNNILSLCIARKSAVILTVKKRGVKENQRRFFPHSIYVRDDKYYVTGFSVTDNEIRTFPFNEIKNIKNY